MQPVTVPVPDGSSLKAEIVLPEGDGPHPGVVILHELFGFNSDIRRIAQRFADNGYAAICPDLYSQGSRASCLTSILSAMAKNRYDLRMAPIVAARDVLAAHEAVDGERIGIAGFCQGGGFAVVAATNPGFKASAVFYGEVPEDQARLAGACPVIASYGGKDKVMGAKTVQRLEDHLDALGVTHQVKVYPDAGHSFMSTYDGATKVLAKFPTPMRVGYNEAAAEDSWERMLTFFGTHVAG